MVQLTSPEELKSVLREGLMCFPVTDFGADGHFARKPFADRLEWLLTYGPNVVVATGGAGEFFSLTMPEASEVVAAAVDVGRGKLPVLAATGFGTKAAIAYAEEAQRLGADGLLLLPPYLTESPQEGLIAHVDAICKATRLGIIVYNRANCVLSAASVERLVEANPNLIAVKDGHGDIEELMRMQSALGDRTVEAGRLEPFVPGCSRAIGLFEMDKMVQGHLSWCLAPSRFCRFGSCFEF